MDFYLRHRVSNEQFDARVTISNGDVTLHSRTGSIRNPDYSPALDAILHRLNARTETIKRVLLDSGPARQRPEAERILALREDFAGRPLKEVGNQIRTRMRKFGRTPDMRPHEGNANKKIRIETSLSDAELRRHLRAVPIDDGLEEGRTMEPARASGRGSALRGPRSQPPTIYFNIGWMKRYAGADPADVTRGGMGYLRDHPHGAEACNFLPDEGGVLRGYRAGHVNRLDIRRLGAAPGAEYLDGVLVVWMAREPSTKRTMIVGWYEGARVHARARPQPRLINGEAWPYSVEATAANGHLLPPEARTFQIESARTKKGGFGMSPTWYGTEEINGRVWRYVQSVRSGSARRTLRSSLRRPPINLDPELRRKVEKAAVGHATAFFESSAGGSYVVESVEPYGRGWDLEAHSDENELLIEVKGLQGTDLVCELTPNEYEKMMMAAHRDKYVIYVVNNALGQTPIASIFKRTPGGHWEADDGRKLNLREKVGAILSCS